MMKIGAYVLLPMWKMCCNAPFLLRVLFVIFAASSLTVSSGLQHRSGEVPPTSSGEIVQEGMIGGPYSDGSNPNIMYQFHVQGRLRGRKLMSTHLQSHPDSCIKRDVAAHNVQIPLHTEDSTRDSHMFRKEDSDGFGMNPTSPHGPPRIGHMSVEDYDPPGSNPPSPLYPPPIADMGVEDYDPPGMNPPSPNFPPSI